MKAKSETESNKYANVNANWTRLSLNDRRMNLSKPCSYRQREFENNSLVDSVFGFMKLDLVEIDYQSLNCTCYHSLYLVRNSEFSKEFIKRNISTDSQNFGLLF